MGRSLFDLVGGLEEYEEDRTQRDMQRAVGELTGVPAQEWRPISPLETGGVGETSPYALTINRRSRPGRSLSDLTGQETQYESPQLDESYWDKFIGSLKTAGANLVGQAYAASGAPFAFGVLSAPYEEGKLDEWGVPIPGDEWNKMSLAQQFLVATGAGMVSMWEAITNPNSFGVTWDQYYEKVTGNHGKDDFIVLLERAGVPDPVTMANQLWPTVCVLMEGIADPTITLGAARHIANLRIPKGYVGKMSPKLLDQFSELDKVLATDDAARRATKSYMSGNVKQAKGDFLKWREGELKRMHTEMFGEPPKEPHIRSGGELIETIEPPAQVQTFFNKPLGREPGKVISGERPAASSRPPDISGEIQQGPLTDEAFERIVAAAQGATKHVYVKEATRAVNRGEAALEFINNVRKDLGLSQYVKGNQAAGFRAALDELSYGRTPEPGRHVYVPDELGRHIPDELVAAMDEVYGRAQTRDAIEFYMKQGEVGVKPEDTVKAMQELIDSIQPGQTVSDLGKVKTVTQTPDGRTMVDLVNNKGKVKRVSLNKIAEEVRATNPTPTLDFMGTQQIWEAVRQAFSKYKQSRSPFTYEPKFDPMATADAFDTIKQRLVNDGGVKVLAPGVDGWERNVMMSIVEPQSSKLQAKYFKGEWFENAIRIFDELDPSGKLKDLFFWPMIKAEDMIVKEFRVWGKVLKELRKSVPQSEREKLMHYAVSRQADGVERLRQAGVDLNKIPDWDQLSKQSQDAYNTMRQIYDKMFERVNSARVRAGRKPIAKVANYFTFASDANALARLNKSLVATPVSVIDRYIHRRTPQYFYAQRMSGKGRSTAMAKTQVDQLPLEKDPFAVMDRYLRHTVEYVHKTPLTAKMNELLGPFHVVGKDGQPVSWALNKSHPHAARFLREWLDFQSGLIPRWFFQHTLFDKAVDVLTYNLTYSILGANVRSALIQPTALRGVFVETSAKDLAYGIRSVIESTTNLKLRKFLDDNAQSISSRQADVMIGDLLEKVSSPGIWNKVADKHATLGKLSLGMLQGLDSISARAAWYAGVNYATRSKAKGGLGLVGREAYKYADDLVMKTQATSSKAARSKVQRHTLGKAATLFQTFVINDFNFLVKQVFGVRSQMPYKERATKLFKYMAASWFTNWFYEDVINVRSPLPTPIRAFSEAFENGSENPTVDGAFAAMREIAGIVPVLGAVEFRSSLGGPVLERVDRLLSGDKYSGAMQFRDVGAAAGVPGMSQIERIAGAMRRDDTLWSHVAGKRTKDYRRGKLGGGKGLSGMSGLSGL